MKKLLIALIVALVALSACAAMAEKTKVYNKPTNPCYDRVRTVSNRPPRKAETLDARLRRYLAGGLYVWNSGVTESGDYYSGRTWTVQPTGGTGSYEYEFFIVDESDRFTSTVHYYRPYGGSNTITFQFLVPDDYYILCNVRDSAGNTAQYYNEFTVPADAAHPTIDSYVSKVLSECRAEGCSGDWDTALWLHDWLTHHVYYDETFSYYGPEDALLRGTAVCDGYSKAYNLLMEAAGIPVHRISSDEINHAWNAVKLDGEWYQVDVTWDDPLAGAKAVTGQEHHMYFCLPDELMKSDHKSYSSPVSCTAYADNYFIRTGKVEMWVGSLREDMQALIDDYIWGDVFAMPYGYAMEGMSGYTTWGNEPIVYGLVAYEVSSKPWKANGETLMMDARYDAGRNDMTVNVRVLDNQLVLPAALKAVEAETFIDKPAIMGIRIPEGVTTIGPRAFADCPNLWVAFIPDSVTEIDPTAFENCPHMNVVCSAGSCAEQFARAHELMICYIS